MAARSVYTRFGGSTLVAPNQTGRLHTVVANETLQSIAALEMTEGGYDSEAWRQLAEYNLIDDLDTLKAGLVLLVPPLKASLT